MKKYTLIFLLCLLPVAIQAQVTTLVGKTADQITAMTDLVTNLDDEYFTTAIGGNVVYLRNAILERGISVTDYSTLAAAINAAESDSNFVVVASASTITATDTVRAHAGLIFTGGGDSRVTISSGVTLYINGAFFAPPNRRVFYGAGTVVFGPGVLSKVYPEWWGAKADSTTDSGTAFKAAYTAVPNGASIELLAGGRTLNAAKGYIVNTTVRIPADKNTKLLGYGATIYSSASDTVFLFNNGSQTTIPSFAVSPGRDQPRHVMEGLRFKRISGYQGNGTAIALLNTTGASFHNIDIYSYNNAFVFNNQSDGWCENNDLFDCRIAAVDTAILYKVTQSGNNSFATNSLHKVTITSFDSSHVIRPGNGQAVGIYSSSGSNLYRNVWDQVVIFPKDSVTCVNIDGKAEDLTGTINFEHIGSTETVRMRGFHFGSNSSELRFRLHMNLTGRRYFDEPNIFYSQISGSFGYSGIETTLDGNQNHGNEIVVDSSKFTPIFGIVRASRLGMTTPADSSRIIFANVNNSADGKLDIRARRNAPIEIRSITDNVYSAATANSVGGSALPLHPVRLLDIGTNRSVSDSVTIDIRNTTHLVLSSSSANADTFRAMKGGIVGQTVTVAYASSNLIVANLSGGTGSGRLFLIDNDDFHGQSGMKSTFKCESESGGNFWRELTRTGENQKTTNYTSTTVDSVDAAQVNFIRLNMSSAGNIRNFYNGIDGQTIIIVHRTSNTTMLHLGKGTSKGLSNMDLANVTATSGLRQTYQYDASDDLWRETARSGSSSAPVIGTVDSTNITNLSVAATDLVNASILNAKIANSAVDSNKVKNSNITSLDIKDGEVHTADVQDGAITFDKLNTARIGNNASLNDSVTVNMTTRTHLVLGSSSANADTFRTMKNGGAAGQIVTVAFSSSNIIVANLSGGTGTGRLFLIENRTTNSQTGMRSYFRCESESGGYFWREIFRTGENQKTTDYTSTTVDSIDASVVNFIRLNMSSAGNIRNFYNGLDGQVIMVLHRTANTTMLHLGKGTSKGLSLIGAANLTGSAGMRQIFQYDAQDDLWRELSRSTTTSSGGWTESSPNVSLSSGNAEVRVGNGTNSRQVWYDADGDTVRIRPQPATNDHILEYLDGGTNYLFFVDSSGTVHSNTFTNLAAGSMVIGSSIVTGITVTTDGTGDGELTVPGLSINTAEITADAIDSSKVIASGLTQSDIRVSALDSSRIAPSGITKTDLRISIIDSSRVTDGSLIGSDIRVTTITPSKLTAAARTRTFSVGLIDTVKAADVLAVVKVPFAITITEVAAFTNTGTATLQVEKRGEATPNTTGTTLLSSSLVADNDQQETTSFASAAVAADQWIVVVMSAVSGGAQRLNVTIRYTVD